MNCTPNVSMVSVYFIVWFRTHTLTVPRHHINQRLCDFPHLGQAEGALQVKRRPGGRTNLVDDTKHSESAGRGREILLFISVSQQVVWTQRCKNFSGLSVAGFVS